ncbi:DUF368 domain-containing protein [Zongyangia hominis]|uniref:DUF368 domain-containing protein n=1 Tax=Zongyangia hominis TaxID=2763677 RepID=A0A926E8W1_9FIRM|nr:DUF368 domain-containing protein [Zongyangia hominis]MBC8569353.1 DUF368 domain-containing protein [Zongyangia hominis]
MEFIKNLLSGAIIGIAEVIPGVSGGTLAVLLGIYDKLIGAISHLREGFRKNLRFLLPLVAGAGVSILLFSRVIEFLLKNFPMAVNFFFLGLIVGIIPMLYKRATADRFKPVHLFPFFITLAVMLAIVFWSGAFAPSASSVLITTMDPLTFLRFLCVGVVAAVCLILPGISGSMMMVIFGIYDSVISAVSSLNIIVLLPVGIGVLIGILFGAKAMDACLHRFPQATYFAILGLVIGSIGCVYMKAGFALFTMDGAIAIVTLVIGMVISLLFSSERFHKKTAVAAEE